MLISQIRAWKKLVVPVSVAILVLLGVFASPASCQAVAEAAGATSVSSAVAGSAKGATMPKFPGGAAAGGAATSPHLPVSTIPAPEETNRKALEGRAGKDAGKLLLRATPVQAQIWIDGKIVGKTPLLLVVSPGKYQIEMRGSRGQTGKSSVDLLPHETREMTVKLAPLYPGRVTVPR